MMKLMMLVVLVVVVIALLAWALQLMQSAIDRSTLVGDALGAVSLSETFPEESIGMQNQKGGGQASSG